MDTRTEFEKLVDRMVKKRIQDGIKRLEARYGPDWVSMGKETWEDPDRGFDIRSGSCCVIGGTHHRSFTDGCETMGLRRWEFDAAERGDFTDSTSALGFDVFADEYLKSNPALTEEEFDAETIWVLLQTHWVEELRKRGVNAISVYEGSI